MNTLTPEQRTKLQEQYTKRYVENLSIDLLHMIAYDVTYENLSTLPDSALLAMAEVLAEKIDIT